MDHRKIILESMAISGGGNLKRSASELALYELFASEDDNKAQEGVDQIFGASEAPDSGSFAAQNGDNSENQNEFSVSNTLADNASLRPQYLYAEQSKFSLSIDSKVSICAGSTLAANISKGRDNQELEDSYDDEQSDDDFFGLEPEAGSCQQSQSCIDIKRFKRYFEERFTN